jgi:hypothetical protein
MHAWKRIPILLTFERVVEGRNTDNLTIVITQALMQQGGLTQEEIVERLICFGANGASIF